MFLISKPGLLHFNGIRLATFKNLVGFIHFSSLKWLIEIQNLMHKYRSKRLATEATWEFKRMEQPGKTYCTSC